MSISSNPETPLSRGDYIFLFAAGLVVAIAIAAMQPVPGYMDADYYYANGMQLASGHGFTEPFLWNYLDNPQGLPHPSNSYWYPLASMIAAAGMFLTGKINFISARIGFVLMAALVPSVVAALAHRITRRRSLALLSGVLAIFSSYYLPFIVTTDNYSLYLLVGALYFLLLDRLTLPKSILLGLLAGLLNLARGDGLLWLPITLVAVAVLTCRQSQTASLRTRILRSVASGFLALLGYFLVMGGWMIRNLDVFGAILPPGGGPVLWMTRYSQVYSFTPELYTFQSWLATGWQAILQVRTKALWQNLGTAFFAQGMIVLSPLILAGIWKCRRLFMVQVAVVGWLVLLLAESLLFPMASVGGGFFHAGTAFQPLWFVLAPVGLEALFALISRNRERLSQAATLLQLSLVIVVVAFSAMLVKMRVIDSGWNEGEYLYQKADQFLVEHGARPEDVVVTKNPPAYYIMTGRQAIVVPWNDIETLLAASRKYNARYIILEEGFTPTLLMDLYNYPENYPEFTYLGALDDSRIYLVKTSQ